jgi:uncharacterized metal-binding protein YceD (DUF177 family)
LADLKKYKIDIFNLPAGTHEYEFGFESDFFENFENSLINIGQGLVRVSLNKSETFLELNFEIEGSIELICDRSLDNFEYPVKIQKDLIVKFGEETEIQDDRIIYVPWNTQTIQLGQFIYEFMSLEIPMKKLHPRYSDDFGDEQEKLIYSSENEMDSENPKNESIDPRWTKLKELKSTNKKKES